MTGVVAADFSPIRMARLGRFTIDRLMVILEKLGEEMKGTLTLCHRPAGSAAATMHG